MQTQPMLFEMHCGKKELKRKYFREVSGGNFPIKEKKTNEIFEHHRLKGSNIFSYKRFIVELSSAV